MTYPTYIEELCEVTYDMWQKGWDEYNGGNVSYRLTEEEIKHLVRDLKDTPFTVYEEALPEVKVMEIPKIIRGQYILITATFSHFRVLHHQPEVDSGIIRLTENGYQVVAGFVTGKKPTSEIFMHILAQASRMEQNQDQRVVIHNHATNIVIYSLLQNITSRSLTMDLWSVLTESIVVFPDGLAVLPWEVPGTKEIGLETARELKGHRMVVWGKHGVLATGTSYQDCFGLIETADKAAHIALELKRISGKDIYENNVLSQDNLRLVCEKLGVSGAYL
ncbi:rhamnulose-1-phosphate aldolase [Streptococcus sp. DD13]|uniref:rhamnulose-1-phosphate aldolase n=1 Tax=Streptococcus sp. DD13 TaxID=1777881 RepID=UPI000797CEF6|nr:rhamnulose-1-phosphate aldolase [Streptococcus sp. DD13]KXT78503.1 Rhamnulose-1-phosphate aldolase [Streptococcus sp. DD13]